ncbi:SUMO ligase siz1 [Mortierella sp. NVP85]|nr:SUMO ligase siz1 [Mortierella sp. NVP85]
MVFCCWADATTSPVLMEFPHVCEIKVNGRVLEANLRGMKNKPGTVSPANITRLFRQETADYNRIEFVYANSSKRYSVSVHTVRRISVESIVAEVERGKFVSKESMLRILEDRNKDDDIQATSSTLSLKCPLGFQRIKIPIRSSYCHHLQCFDAFTFFNLNEQTPTWTCPVCSRVMHSWEEIVVDGYFKDILSNTPSSLESITVQADGSWELPSASSSSQPVASPSPKMRPTAPAGDSVFIIDEDDDDDDVSDKIEERRAERTPPPPPKPAKPAIEVIDLISDSEDEAEILPTTMELDGDTYMRDVFDRKTDSGTSTSVKTESFEKATPTETGMAPASTEVYSIIGSTNESSASASSGTSPVVPMRMAESTQMGPLSPESRMHPAWEAGEDTFANVLLGPRRKRQYDGKMDSAVIIDE